MLPLCLSGLGLLPGIVFSSFGHSVLEVLGNHGAGGEQGIRFIERLSSILKFGQCSSSFTLSIPSLKGGKKAFFIKLSEKHRSHGAVLGIVCLSQQFFDQCQDLEFVSNTPLCIP